MASSPKIHCGLVELFFLCPRNPRFNSPTVLWVNYSKCNQSRLLISKHILSWTIPSLRFRVGIVTTQQWHAPLVAGRPGSLEFSNTWPQEGHGRSWLDQAREIQGLHTGVSMVMGVPHIVRWFILWKFHDFPIHIYILIYIWESF